MKNNPISRREFLRVCGTVIAGTVLASVFGILSKRRLFDDQDEPEYFWQIDPAKCTFCGRCEMSCVLPVSAVKCFHATRVCGYCDLCGGYYRSNVKELNTAAENLITENEVVRLELGFKANPDITELTTAAGLLLMTSVCLDFFLDFFAIRHTCGM